MCELLVGVPPSAILATIFTLYETLNDANQDNVSSISYIQECRDIVCVVCKMLTAMQLFKCMDWKQVFTAATTRHQQLFSALIVALVGDNDQFDPAIVSS